MTACALHHSFDGNKSMRGFKNNGVEVAIYYKIETKFETLLL